MPYVIVSTKICIEAGPTTVGDEKSDHILMKKLGAEKMMQLGNNYHEYRVNDPPRVVLNKLEVLGYSIVASTGIGQTCVWTLHKPLDFE